MEAQMNLDSLIQLNKNKHWPIQLLEGKWQGKDSFCSIIEFVKTGSIIQLLPKVHTSPYVFNIKDSVLVSGAGVAINWPPYDCVISELTENSLDIIYYNFANIHPWILHYKRKANR